MEQRPDSTPASAKILADISALADGTLDPAREPAIRALIDGSPELAERYEEERRAVAALHSLRSERAPDRLRARVEAERRAAKHRGGSALERRRGGRLVYGGGLAVALAAAVLALVLVLPGGAPGAPSVSQAAALALRGATGPGPGVDPNRAGRLNMDVQEVYFPNLASLHYRVIGQRVDRLDGHPAVTVYYLKGGRTIAYTIVATALKLSASTSGAWGTRGLYMHTAMIGTRWVISWRRAGDTCVVSGSGPSRAELAAFAG